MDIWQFIEQHLNKNNPVVLLVVLHSEGSSPGRQGFKMAVSINEELCGTIGGGIMEHKLVSKAREMLKIKDGQIQVTKQYHDKQHGNGQSGMICSGNQHIAFFSLHTFHLPDIKLIFSQKQNAIKLFLQFSPKGIVLKEHADIGFHYSHENDWQYTEQLFQNPRIHIIGAGHVGLALSEIMHFLEFDVFIYDDRSHLNTNDQNIFAQKKYLVEYEKLNQVLTLMEEDYIVIMTIGYRTDKIVLKQLLGNKAKYIGLLGSQYKIEKLFTELLEEGISSDLLKTIYAPVGLPVCSQTSKEIAISIAAEIIKEKNKNLSSGRSNLRPA